MSGLQGISFLGRFGERFWPMAAQTLFVIAVAYAFAFVAMKTRFPWLLAGIVGGLIHVLIQLPFLLSYGTPPGGSFLESNWQSMAVMFFELFVACCAAAFVTSLIPVDRPDKPRSRSNYY
ncbi:MAG TPA: hypothetical protein VK934_07275 [Fimbriimonas sp.]|nr:hypothetical protein [Fimbriimonas sp.]